MWSVHVLLMTSTTHSKRKRARNVSQRSATKQIDYINAGLPAGVCTFPRRQSPNGWGSGVSSAWWRTGREAPVSRHCIYIPYPSWDCSRDLPVDCLWGNIAMDWHKKHLWGFITNSRATADQEPGSFTALFYHAFYLVCISVGWTRRSAFKGKVHSKIQIQCLQTNMTFFLWNTSNILHMCVLFFSTLNIAK